MATIYQPTQPTNLETRFTYHKPTEAAAQKYPILREKAKVLAYLIHDLCPDCRETSLALTKLEEVIMWANAGISRYPDDK